MPDRNADHEARDRSDSPLSSIPDSPPPITQRSQRAPRKSYVDDTDSDLTDFSGDETSDDEIITARPRASRSNREEVKTKGKPSSKAKGKAKPKTKTKTKTRTKKRSKGKGKAQGDDSDREPEDGEAPKVKGKKQLVAKAVGWHDIPEWKEGSGCPVMSLPAEILDMTFGLRSGLRVGGEISFAPYDIPLTLLAARLRGSGRDVQVLPTPPGRQVLPGESWNVQSRSHLD